MSTAPYPHVEMHVRDDSIYTPIASEVLPLHKPLYMMRAQKGPIGIPVWCETYQIAARTFGADTFNKRSEYFSEQAYFLLKTFPSNGAFIMRVANTNAHPSEISIEVGVSKEVTAIPQWLRDSNGRFMYETDGSKIPINADGEECGPLEVTYTVASSTFLADTKYYTRSGSGTTEDPYVYTKAKAGVDYTVGQTIPANTYYTKNPLPTYVYTRALETVAISGVQYYTRTENYDYSKVIPTDRRIVSWQYFLGIDTGKPKFSEVDTSKGVEAGAFYFEQVSSTDKTFKPVFTLSAFETGKTYVKLVDFTDGFRQAAESELPGYGPGQTIGDMFSSISDATIKLTLDSATGFYYGDNTDTASVTAWKTYRFTRALSKTNPYTYTAVTIPAGMDLTDRTYYRQTAIEGGSTLEPQATIGGRKLAWRAHVIASYDASGNYTRTRPVGDATSYSTDKFTWYPLIDIVAENPGIWGQKFGFRLFLDEKKNTVSGTVTNSAVTYTLAPIQLVGDDTTPTEITDAYGSTAVEGVVRPGVVDAETDTDLTLDKKLKACYSGRYALPIQFTLIKSNWNLVGKLIMSAEIAKRNEIEKLYPDFRVIYDAEGDQTPETFVDALFDKVATDADLVGDAGYMANIVTAVDCEKIPHFCSAVVDSTDKDVVNDTKVTTKTEIIVPGASSAIYLGAGSDGEIDDYNVEKQIRAQITAAIGQTQEYLIDYARCPFNSIIDTGVSLETKKAYLDLMTVRDSLVVNLATQITWKNAAGVAPGVNSRYVDESMGSSLRAYAWLMKEDVANGTEACRAKIFLHAGYRTDHDLEVPCASTLWIAMKNAEYLNRTYILKEAKELPNASVDCWEDISWVAASEDTKSRCWNAGLNYVQFYNMTKYHYASVRTVYRYETSILVDAGVVDALTFMKDEVRRSWAKFAGSTRPAEELNLDITNDLTSRFSYLLNGKYNFSVTVYQTDEDKKLGFVRHVDIELIAPATNRVWIATIICKRENFEPEA